MRIDDKEKAKQRDPRKAQPLQEASSSPVAGGTLESNDRQCSNRARLSGLFHAHSDSDFEPNLKLLVSLFLQLAYHIGRIRELIMVNKNTSVDKTKIISSITEILVNAGHSQQEAAMLAEQGYANSLPHHEPTLPPSAEKLLTVFIGAARRAIRSYGMSNMVSAEDGLHNPYPLVDLLSTEGESIATGEYEIDLIVDSIYSEARELISMTIDSQIERSVDILPDPIKGTCTDCNGSGEAFGSFACEECGGTGTVNIAPDNATACAHAYRKAAVLCEREAGAIDTTSQEVDVARETVLRLAAEIRSFEVAAMQMAESRSDR